MSDSQYECSGSPTSLLASVNQPGKESSPIRGEGQGRTAAKVWDDGDWLSVGRKLGSKGNTTKTTAMVFIIIAKNFC